MQRFRPGLQPLALALRRPLMELAAAGVVVGLAAWSAGCRGGPDGQGDTTWRSQAAQREQQAAIAFSARHFGISRRGRDPANGYAARVLDRLSG